MPEDFDLTHALAARTQALRQSGQDPELLALLERAGLHLARLEEVHGAARDLTNRLQPRGDHYVRIGSAQLVAGRLHRLEVAVATADEVLP